MDSYAIAKATGYLDAKVVISLAIPLFTTKYSRIAINMV